MRIESLDLHREHIATLAAWHHAEWGHLYDGWTLAMARVELQGHVGANGLPTTLVLLDGDRLAGSVSLVLEDAPELCEQGSPWLANLYVAADARGRGWGARLVNAAVELAARQEIPELYLFTPEHSEFYQRLGWRIISRTRLKGTPVDLMEMRPVAAAA